MKNLNSDFDLLFARQGLVHCVVVGEILKRAGKTFEMLEIITY